MTDSYWIIVNLTFCEVSISLFDFSCSFRSFWPEVGKLSKNVEHVRLLESGILLCEKQIDSIETRVKEVIVVKKRTLVNTHLLYEHL